MVVVPAPSIVPPVRVRAPATVRFPPPVRPLFKVSDPPELTVSVIPPATVTCPTLTAVPLWMTGWLATLGMLAVSPTWGVVPPQVDQLPAVAQFVDEAPVHPHALARACRAGVSSAKNARIVRRSRDT